jgi:pimeloyl-ACP methyl ester carboxylesterase
MREQLIQFGDNARLVGTLLNAEASMPTGSNDAPKTSAKTSAKTAVLNFNAGLIPRTGPHRLWVKLARYLAKDGLSSFRFDLNGQGDSAQVHTGLPFEAQAVQDIVEAMNAVQEHTGIERFVLVGICSGAALSYKAALADPRVVACAMIDVYMYPTWRTRWVTFKHRAEREGVFKLLKDASILRLQAVKNRLGGVALLSMPNALPGLVRPTPDEFAHGLQTLLSRQTRLLLVYTGSFLFHYNYANQFVDRFKSYQITGPMRIDFDPHLDHTVTELSAQSFVLDKLSRWIQQH